MKFFKIGLPLAGAVWICVVAVGLFLHFGPNMQFLGLSTRAASVAQGQSGGSLGEERHLLLVEATRVYIEGIRAASPKIAQETELAPVIFLNDQLESKGAKWRVRSTDGPEVVTYEVS